jgi:hypothetical protein
MKDDEAPVGLRGVAEALRSAKYTSGSTHGFYHYPARFSPDSARAIIEAFSEHGDCVMDPFMGGGTSVIEGLVAGRNVIGVDINALAHFVTSVRTTPLSGRDADDLMSWAERVALRLGRGGLSGVGRPMIRNLPNPVEVFAAGALEESDHLPRERQRAFARCVLLRLGQWALDCRDFTAPRRSRLARKLPELTAEMIRGLWEFVEACGKVGIRKNQIADSRRLLHRSAVGLEAEPLLSEQGRRPRLVFTSPPYPGVHVLYHRWQYRGRKETAAPYWIARVPDGFYGSHYTGGSRTPTGQQNYFDMITAAFSSVRRVMDPDGLVVQLIGFSKTATQLPRYLDAMEHAGFEESPINHSSIERLDRRVPNRKWYAKLQEQADASTELLLFHRPKRSDRRAARPVAPN